MSTVRAARSDAAGGTPNPAPPPCPHPDPSWERRVERGPHPRDVVTAPAEGGRHRAVGAAGRDRGPQGPSTQEAGDSQAGWWWTESNIKL